ncbi:DNA mismatch repair protein [Nocardia nova]|uniref:MutS-related protein n=1 Tax=Nocardia nova TaxID=37330 RepID=UPI00379BF101
MKVDLLAPEGVSGGFTTPNGGAVVEDLDLDPVFQAMARGDQFILEVVRTVVPRTLSAPELIRYRQEILADCCAHPDALRQLYEIATAATSVRRWTIARGREPQAKLRLSLEPLSALVDQLRELRTACLRFAPVLRSAGLSELARRLVEQLADEYLDRIQHHVELLHFEHGLQLSAGLGPGNKAADILLHEPLEQPRRRRFGLRSPHTFRIPNDDDAATNYLKALFGRSVQPVAETVSHVTDLVQNFFRALRTELAFYLGCVNLHEQLRAAGHPTCFPTPLPPGRDVLRCTDLRDPTLCVRTGTAVTGNRIDADGIRLLVVTGANSGGKSTCLRSLGAAQVMMQAGMFVVAESFEADVRDGIFTHFRVPDDATMTSGRLREELGRLAEIADRLRPTSLLLFNEPLASTNEREAGEIVGPVVHALTDTGVKLVLVTHLYDLAHELYQRHDPAHLFLRAERLRDGTRTYRMVEGEPEAGSHGLDIFRRIFADDRSPV